MLFKEQQPDSVSRAGEFFQHHRYLKLKLEGYTMNATTVNLKAIEDVKSLDSQESTHDQSVSAEKAVHVGMTVFQKFGRVFISWSISPDYPLRNDRDQYVDLLEGSSTVASQEVTSRSGEFDTGKPWGTGYAGRLRVFTATPGDVRYIPVLTTPITE